MPSPLTPAHARPRRSSTARALAAALALAAAAPAVATAQGLAPGALYSLRPGDAAGFDITTESHWTVERYTDPLAVRARLTLEVAPAPGGEEGGPLRVSARLEPRSVRYSRPDYRFRHGGDPLAALVPVSPALRAASEGTSEPYERRLAIAEEALGVAIASAGGRTFTLEVPAAGPVRVLSSGDRRLGAGIPLAASRVLEGYVGAAARLVLPAIGAEREPAPPPPSLDRGASEYATLIGLAPGSVAARVAPPRTARVVRPVDGVEMSVRGAGAALGGRTLVLDAAAGSLALAEEAAPFTLHGSLGAPVATIATEATGAAPPPRESTDPFGIAARATEGRRAIIARGTLSASERHGFAARRALHVEETTDLIPADGGGERYRLTARMSWTASIVSARLGKGLPRGKPARPAPERTGSGPLPEVQP
jgi:hypothetical protein